MKKRLLIGGALFVLGLGGVIGGYVLYKVRQGRDVHGSSVEFSTTQKEKEAPPPPQILWPMYGYDQERHRAPVGFRLRPPYRPLWRFPGRDLLEFPPALGYGHLYFTNNVGVLYALEATHGHLSWRFNTGRCAAASPALYRRLVIAVFLNKPPCNSTRSPSSIDGLIAAFDIDTGRVRWRHVIGPSETSPVIANGVVYVGDWRNDVYAFTATTGRQHWKYHTDGKVKGGAAISGNRLYIGSYDGHVYALDTRTGRRVWRASVQGRLGHSGTFYSGPSVAYGRVYIGSTDGKVYSYGARSGKLRWSHGTGSYVYASPAVWRGLILIGSYDGTFYAFDAATGDIRWKFDAHKGISGSAVVINGVVYFSSLRGRTYALSARTGRALWTFGDGQYAAAISGRRRLYLMGYSRLYALIPKNYGAGPGVTNR